MKTLVSMTDFVISQIKTDSTVNDSFKKDLANIRNYALFLKQNLTLGMFVPCYEEKHLRNGNWGYSDDLIIYNKAKEKLLFYGFSIDNGIINLPDGSKQDVKNLNGLTVEDLVYFKPKLTENALKQIFG